MHPFRYMQTILRAPEGEGSGGSEEQKFSADYVRELRAENKGLRLKLRGFEDENPKLKAAADDADKRVAEAEKAGASKAAEGFNARLVAAELKAAATKAGIVDLDGLKVLDTSGIKVNSDGQVAIPEDFFAKAREAKPYLFATTGADKGTTTNSQTPPPPAATTTKKASAMTVDELRAFESNMGINL